MANNSQIVSKCDTLYNFFHENYTIECCSSLSLCENNVCYKIALYHFRVMDVGTSSVYINKFDFFKNSDNIKLNACPCCVGANLYSVLSL